MITTAIIHLLKDLETEDEYGVYHTELISRKVYAEVYSITQREWHNAGVNGLKPQLKFVMFYYDYNGEEVIEYNKKQYYVYRTYVNGDYIELYTEFRKGTEDGKKEKVRP